MFVSASEVFPTEVRNAGMGVIMVFGGVANMASSFIGPEMVSSTNNGKIVQRYNAIKNTFLGEVIVKE